MKTTLTILRFVAGGGLGAFLGGCLGFLVARILIESVGVVDGPPAGVLLVLLVLAFGLVGGVLGVLFCLRWQRKRRRGAA